jgi:hypothetical protein
MPNRHDRLFRALMHVLPAEFRGDCGREMESHFRDSRRDEGLRPALIGLGLGVIAAIVFGRAIEAQLFGVTTRDALTYTLVLIVMCTSGCGLPAARPQSRAHRTIDRASRVVRR